MHLKKGKKYFALHNVRTYHSGEYDPQSVMLNFSDGITDGDKDGNIDG